MKRLALCLLLCAVHPPVTAHVLDQYLQAAQLALAPSGVTVELRLTPGTQVAERIFALLDADGDGQLSAAETKAYAERVRQDIVLKTDSRWLLLLLTETDFPTRQEMKEGTGEIRLTFTANADLRASGAHQLVFQNHHLSELSVYLANVLVPEAREIAVTGQQRDALQRELRLDYRVTERVSGASNVIGVALQKIPLYAPVAILLLALIALAAYGSGMRRSRHRALP